MKTDIAQGFSRPVLFQIQTESQQQAPRHVACTEQRVVIFWVP